MDHPAAIDSKKAEESFDPCKQIPQPAVPPGKPSALHRTEETVIDVAYYASRVTYAIAPSILRGLGPEGMGIGVAIQEAQEVIPDMVARHSAKAALDRHKDQLAKTGTGLLAPDSVANKIAYTLGEHSRQKDIKYAVQTLGSLEMDNSEWEDRLSHKLDRLEARNNQALADMGLPPEQHGLPQTQPNRDSAAESAERLPSFPLLPRHRGEVVGAAAKDVAVTLISPFSTAPLGRVAEMGKVDLGFDNKVLDRKEQLDSVTAGLSDDVRQAYRNRFVRDVALHWDTADMTDKKLAVDLLRKRTDAVENETLRLYVSDLQMEGYPKRDYVYDPGVCAIGITSTYGQDVEQREAMAKAVKSAKSGQEQPRQDDALVPPIDTPSPDKPAQQGKAMVPSKP